MSASIEKRLPHGELILARRAGQKARVITMPLIALVVGVSGAILGLWAAWLWFQASRVVTKPVWGACEPGEATASQAGWIAGMLNAGAESARLNQRAALVTALAVALSTGSGIIGLFA